MDNSNTPHRPNLDALVAASIPYVTGPPAAPAPDLKAKAALRVARAAPEASYEHPLRTQLDSLEYPAPLWAPPEPQPPKVCFVSEL